MDPEKTLKKNNELNEMRSAIGSRDVYFMYWLSEYAVPQVAPRVYRSYMCGKGNTREGQHWSMLIEKLDDNMDSYAKKYALKMGLEVPKRCLPYDLFVQMILLVNELDKYGIVHGDVSGFQFLYSEQKHRVYLNDYGFSGQTDDRVPSSTQIPWNLTNRAIRYLPILGWVVNKDVHLGLGCGAQSKWEIPKGSLQILENKHPLVDGGLLEYLNLLQLDAYLWKYQYYIQEKDDTISRYGLPDHNILPLEKQEEFADFCPDYNEIVNIRRNIQFHKTKISYNLFHYSNVLFKKYKLS